MKKVLITIITMLLPILASAEAVEIGGIWYNLVSKVKQAEVTKMPSGYYSGAIEIPDKVSYEGSDYSVTSIEESAFRDCRSLTSIILSLFLNNIDKYAFYNCPNLADIYCLAENVPNMNIEAFNDSYFENATLHVPAASVEAYKSTYPWSKIKKVVALTDQELSINGVISDNNAEIVRYTIGGQRTNQSCKGLNVVRMSDGTTKKVIVK